jgi:hypothetical protein
MGYRVVKTVKGRRYVYEQRIWRKALVVLGVELGTGF